MQTKLKSSESFEHAVEELESIVSALEVGTLTLEEALSRYQRGMDLLKFCHKTLENAEQRILQLESGALSNVNELQG